VHTGTVIVAALTYGMHTGRVIVAATTYAKNEFSEQVKGKRRTSNDHVLPSVIITLKIIHETQTLFS